MLILMFLFSIFVNASDFYSETYKHYTDSSWVNYNRIQYVNPATSLVDLKILSEYFKSFAELEGGSVSDTATVGLGLELKLTPSLKVVSDIRQSMVSDGSLQKSTNLQLVTRVGLVGYFLYEDHHPVFDYASFSETYFEGFQSFIRNGSDMFQSTLWTKFGYRKKMDLEFSETKWKFLFDPLLAELRFSLTNSTKKTQFEALNIGPRLIFMNTKGFLSVLASQRWVRSETIYQDQWVLLSLGVML